MKLCLECGERFDGEGWGCPACSAGPGHAHGIPLFAPELIDQSDDYDPAIFETLAEIEPDSFWFRGRNALLIWALGKYFPNARSFLELGCGTGFVLSAFQEAYPHIAFAGADIHPEGLAFARRRFSRGDLYQFDARRIPFRDEFDVIGAFDVLEHIEDDETVLREMFQAVRPGGGVLVTVPQHARLWSTADEYAGHKRRYGRRELVEKVRAAGFTIRRVTSFVSVLLPPMAASRVVQRLRGTSYDLRREHARSALVGTGLERLLAGERTLIGRGLSLPAGGSLLLVASCG